MTRIVATLTFQDRPGADAAAVELRAAGYEVVISDTITDPHSDAVFVEAIKVFNTKDEADAAEDEVWNEIAGIIDQHDGDVSECGAVGADYVLFSPFDVRT
jgi:hypothetical protein